MDYLVSFEVGGLTKTPTAQVAAVRLLTRVSPLMLSETVLLCEVLPTVGTAKRFSSCVSPLVRFQVAKL